MSMIKVDNDNFESELLSDDSLKILMVGASWCGHCKSMRPIVTEYADANPEVKICYSDADESGQILSKYGINSIPCIIAIKGQAEIERKVGFMPKNELEAMVSRNK